MHDSKTADDFGMLWLIPGIFLTIAIGCAVVAYIEGHTVIDYKIQSGLQQFEQKFSHASIRKSSQAPLVTVKDSIPSNYTMVLQ